jgi:hypothetical protein
MSIYVLRSRDLYKIGFSSNLAERVQSIMDTVPGAVEFMGHMPGGMDVETHLHERFADDRFSGEWFTGSQRLLGLIACLDPVKPEIRNKRALGAARGDAERVLLANRVRSASARAWPEQNHANRIKNVAAELGWGERRMRCVYHCERYTLLASEAPALDRWLAEWELASPTPTNEPTSQPAGASNETKGE